MDHRVDFDFTAPIDIATWIRQGKTFPSGPEVPAGLLEYCQRRLDIPHAHRSQLLPDRDLPVDQFLKLHLPALSNALVNFKPERWFSCEPPNEDFTFLIRHTIPPKPQLAKLKDAFGQAILDGAQSISDPQYHTSRLPLFSIQFWSEMSDIHDIQKQWQDSSLWIRNLAENVTDPGLDEATHQLRSLPWNGVIRGSKPSGDISTSTLTRLLGVRWIDGDLIDAMIQHLQSRLEADTSLRTRIMITNSALMQEIAKAKSPADFDTPRKWLVRLEESIQCRDRGPILYFPAHVSEQQHWICFRINFDTQTLSYGMKSVPVIMPDANGVVPADSLAHDLPKPTKIFRQLQWWLAKRFGTSFPEDDAMMISAMQDDFFSCGIIAINTIAHHVFGDEH